MIQRTAVMLRPRSRWDVMGVWMMSFSVMGREALAQGGGSGGYLDGGIFAVLVGAALFAVCKGSRRG